MIAASPRPEPLPAGTESGSGVHELVATAISNIQARSDLAASRADRGGDRRRAPAVVRDLHDGAQQRLVHTVITLKLARRALERGDSDAIELVGEALGQAERATDELRELAHGILPSVLARGGLRAGWRRSRGRMPLPVEVDVSVGRLPRPVEASAYFVVAEALTNVAKHSRAGRAAVTATSRTARCRSGCATTASGGAGPTEAACWAWRTGSPCSTAGSTSRARPTAARWSPPPSRSRADTKALRSPPARN